MELYKKLITDIKNAGIKKGMTIIVHSSFKSLQTPGLTPELLIKGFQEVLGIEGNLIIPTLTYKTVNKDNPFFNIKTTPSCVGIVSEIFRNMENVYRSLNPIHSVAVWGKNAIKLVEKDSLDNITLGKNSPFNKMRLFDAKICMLGCGLKPNTFMHLIENHNKLPYRKTVCTVDFKLIDYNDNEIIKSYDLPNMQDYDQRYDRVSNILKEPDLYTTKIGEAITYIIDANKLFEEASKVLTINPYYFVDKI